MAAWVPPAPQAGHDTREALRANPYAFHEHVTVTTKDGVVTLSGFVLDVWDLFTLKRIARKTAGVKRLVDQVNLELGGD
jgi:osmotically-inducible protein OsmY